MYGYIRVSTLKQGEGVSLQEQKEAIARYAQQHNFEISEWIEEKETAAKQGRPLFSAIIKQLQAKKSDGVIIHKIDRSARNIQDWADISELLDNEIEIHFAHESLDLKSRSGRLCADMQAVIATDYIRNLKQETKKGIDGRLKQGFYPFQAPTGYLNNGGGKYKTIDPLSAPLVKKAFELYASQKYSLDELAERMWQLGLRNLRQGRIRVENLSRILRNPFYMGVLKVNNESFKGGHEPLISTTLFKQAQGVMQGKTNQKTTRHNFLFKKLLTCHECGYSLIGELQKGNVYFRCHTKECSTKGMREITINRLLVNAFDPLQLHPQEAAALDTLLADTEKNWINTHQQLEHSLKLQRGQTEQRLARLTDCYLDGDFGKDEFEKRKEKLLVEVKAIEEKERQFSTEKSEIFSRAKKFLELVKSFKNSYEKGITEEKRRLIEIATSNLVIEERKLGIAMRTPFFEMSQRYNLPFGAPNHNTHRIDNTKIVYSDIDTPPVVTEPVSEDKLRHLLDLILQNVMSLPIPPNDVNYDI